MLWPFTASWMGDQWQSASLGAHIPVEMQNQSLVVQGTIRVLKESSADLDMSCVRAIQAEVMDHVVNGAVGWELDGRGCGVGRHFSHKHQDPW